MLLGRCSTGRAISVDQSYLFIAIHRISLDRNGASKLQRTRFQSLGNIARTNVKQRSSANVGVPEWQHLQPLRSHVSP